MIIFQAEFEDDKIVVTKDFDSIMFSIFYRNRIATLKNKTIDKSDIVE